MNAAVDEVFGRRVVLPDGDADARLQRLVGMDEVIEQMAKILGLLIFPQRLSDWWRGHHPDSSVLFEYVRHRHPLVIIAGDVGTGKTELSETIGSRVSRNEKLEITLFPMSLSIRGSGLVGEMTKLISSAFDCIEEECGKIAKGKNGYSSGVIMLIDEADALAQSRESGQMHHEDRAGVNALIRGIDSLNRRQFPVAVIMCTNRLDAIDPAVARRAADTFVFHRPGEKQREHILRRAFGEIGFSDDEIARLVKITGETAGRSYGYTFSDITQKLFHAVVISAYPDDRITFARVMSAAEKIQPTPPFRNE